MKLMQLCTGLMAFFAFSFSIACTEMPKINPYEAKVRNVTFEKGVTQKWCLKIAEGSGSGMIEWDSINQSNTSCGVLKMVVYLPDGSKLKSEGTQPGTVTAFKPGTYKMSYKMQTNIPNCRTWTLGSRWSPPK